MLLDVHTHVNFKAFEKDGHEVIRRALDEGVGMILVGSQNSTSRRAVEYAAQYKDEAVFAAVGLHPIHLEDRNVDSSELGGEGSAFSTRAEEFDYDYYKKLAMDEKVVAIGEVGLDYYHTNPKEHPQAIEKQKQVFRKQIELALDVQKALMIHCRKAHDDCIAILKEYYPPSKNLKLKTKNSFHGDIHFFEGTVEQAHEYFKLGFTVSFTGVITFKNSAHHQNLVRQLPLDRMLLETDAPYITPEPHRGERNEPRYVKLVAQKIAEIKGISLDEVARVTTQSAINVFCLKI